MAHAPITTKSHKYIQKKCQVISSSLTYLSQNSQLKYSERVSPPREGDAS